MIAAHKAAEMTMVLFIPTDPRPDPAATSIARVDCAHRLWPARFRVNEKIPN